VGETEACSSDTMLKIKKIEMHRKVESPSTDTCIKFIVEKTLAGKTSPSQIRGFIILPHMMVTMRIRSPVYSN
jgi:hypothetical protein